MTRDEILLDTQLNEYEYNAESKNNAGKEEDDDNDDDNDDDDDDGNSCGAIHTYIQETDSMDFFR